MSTYRSKRRREEPSEDEDSDLDEEEKEAMRAFKQEGFNEDMEKVEAERKKKVSCCTVWIVCFLSVADNVVARRQASLVRFTVY